MSIVFTPTERGYHYTCDCGNPDIEVDRGEDYYCLSCDSWRAWPSKDEVREMAWSNDPNHCPRRYEDIQACKDAKCVCLPALLTAPRKCKDCGAEVHYSWMGAYCKECLQTGSGLFQ